jgi:hypothetical protein
MSMGDRHPGEFSFNPYIFSKNQFVVSTTVHLVSFVLLLRMLYRGDCGTQKRSRWLINISVNAILAFATVGVVLTRW